MTAFVFEVGIDFSHFNLWLQDGARIHMPHITEGLSPGLAVEIEVGQIMLVTATQGGMFPVDVRIEDTPVPPEDEWPDFAEFSITAGKSSSLEEWDIGSNSFELPLTPGQDYRVRYVILDGQLARDHRNSNADGPPPGKYILQIWPQPAVPSTVRKTSQWAQSVCRKK